MSDSRSVVYRDGRLTAADYDEAIEALQRAKNALEEGDSYGCMVCEDSGHSAAHCHHNPLVLARHWASATSVWQCYHCGFVATNDDEATAHFGRSDADEPACLAARGQLKIAWGHIEHMAAFIGSRKLGYSFESLGEHAGEIRRVLGL